ncbi:MAG: histidine phosphatase family protein [Sulfurifustaceae bacterium]
MGAIYLIRHGQASFGKTEYDELSEMGVEQSRLLGDALRSRLPNVDVVFCGTQRRHRQTADACLRAYGYTDTPQETADLNEYDHNEIVERYEPRYVDRQAMFAELSKTGNLRRAFQEMFTKAVARWVSGQHDTDYTESWPSFRARCLRALDHIVQSSGSSKTALVFTSGGPISAVSQTLLRIPDAYAFQINWTLVNCGVTKIIYSERGKYLLTLNEHSHFEGERKELITYR